MPQLDGDGHLKDASLWTEEIAAELATEEQLEITADHLRVCRCLRLFHERFGTEPTHRAFAHFMRAELGAEWADSSFLALLFPGGVMRQASRIAGLPKPRYCL